MANETTYTSNIVIGDQLQGASGETLIKLPKLDCDVLSGDNGKNKEDIPLFQMVQILISHKNMS